MNRPGVSGAPPGSWPGWRMRSMCWAGRCTGSCRRWPPTGFDVAPGALCGALKQVAPLIAPWAEAISALCRTAGHVHAGETSWQVFGDIEDKDGRSWLRTFVTGATTVFVMGTSRSAGAAVGQLGTGREHTALQAGRWSSPRTSARRISRWPASTASTRCGAGLISGGIPCGPGPRTPRRPATGAMRGPGGSRRCPGPATPWPPPHSPPHPAPGTRARPGLLARAEPPDDARFNYAPAAPELIARARALAGICARHGVELPAAAVQFPLRHPAVASVVSGMRTGQQVDSTLARFTTVVPDEAWLELDGR